MTLKTIVFDSLYRMLLTQDGRFAVRVACAETGDLTLYMVLSEKLAKKPPVGDGK